MLRQPALLVAIVASSLAGPVARPVLAGDVKCYADWSEAAPVVRSEGLATVGALSAAARSNGTGDIVKTTLCKEDGRFVYRLVVRNARGELMNLTVDARAPFAR